MYREPDYYVMDAAAGIVVSIVVESLTLAALAAAAIAKPAVQCRRDARAGSVLRQATVDHEHALVQLLSRAGP